MDVVIIISNVIDFNNKAFNIGGVQTYVKDLSKFLISNNYKVKLCQLNTENIEIIVDEIPVIGYLSKARKQRIKIQQLYNYVNTIVGNKGVVIVSTDQLDIKSKNPRVVNIQHGIAFDFPHSMIKNRFTSNRYMFRINKLLRSLKNIKRLTNVPNTVCVDYNYFNWYRTLANIPDNNNFEVIPNYTSNIISEEKLAEKLEKTSPKSILFARRFVDYRGTILFANVVERILKEYENVFVSFAGDGPLKEFLKEKFENHKRVKIFSFSADQSIDIHYQYDIAVVPTIFSEGTSLSLCEASAAGCFPIATHVGGMTNMVIDGYNGRLVYPNENEVYKAVVETLDMPVDDFKSIVTNAWQIASISFSKEVWQQRWLKYIKKIMH